jgi:hypothetical protein
MDTKEAGRRGGKARAAKLTTRERKRIARKGHQASTCKNCGRALGAHRWNVGADRGRGECLTPVPGKPNRYVPNNERQKRDL